MSRASAGFGRAMAHGLALIQGVAPAADKALGGIGQPGIDLRGQTYFQAFFLGRGGVSLKEHLQRGSLA